MEHLIEERQLEKIYLVTLGEFNFSYFYFLIFNFSPSASNFSLFKSNFGPFLVGKSKFHRNCTRAAHMLELNWGLCNY